jgi:hypothetical protein
LQGFCHETQIVSSTPHKQQPVLDPLNSQGSKGEVWTTDCMVLRLILE